MDVRYVVNMTSVSVTTHEMYVSYNMKCISITTCETPEKSLTPELSESPVSQVLKVKQFVCTGACARAVSSLQTNQVERRQSSYKYKHHKIRGR